MARREMQSSESEDGIVRLGCLSELTISSKPLDQAGGAVRSTAQFDVRVVYSDVVDVEVEKARLKKELDGLQKAISSKESQLGNETFRSRAPEQIIRGLEVTLAEQRIELHKDRGELIGASLFSGKLPPNLSSAVKKNVSLGGAVRAT